MQNKPGPELRKMQDICVKVKDFKIETIVTSISSKDGKIIYFGADGKWKKKRNKKWNNKSCIMVVEQSSSKLLSRYV